MPLTYPEAVDEMFNKFFVQWALGTTSIVGYVPEVRWNGREYDKAPDNSKFWVRVSQQTVSEGQTCFQNGVEKRYTADGLLFIQIFCPKSATDAIGRGRLLAQFARNIYRGKTTPGKIVFHNVRINELDDEDNFKRFNVVAEYEYDEIG